MEGLISMLPIALIFLAGFALTGFVSRLKQAQQASKTEGSDAVPGQKENAKEPSPMPTAKTAAENSAPAPFARAYETDRIGWDSQSDFHEGEDPCHDDLEATLPERTDQPASQPEPHINDLIKGIVIGEVLARRRQKP